MSTYGRNSTVRSHRRGGARRRVKLAPWLITGAVLCLVAAGVTAGYTYFIKDSCSGQAQASIVVTNNGSSSPPPVATSDCAGRGYRRRGLTNPCDKRVPSQGPRWIRQR